jgi:Na+/phosphate symporter
MLLYQLPKMKKHSEDFIPIIRSAELLERLGDDFARSIVRSLKKIAREDIRLSVESAAELQIVSKKITALLNSYAKALEDENGEMLKNLLQENRGIKASLRSMRKSHFLALKNKLPSAVKSGSYLLDIISELESSTVKIKALLKIMLEHFEQEGKGE